MILVKIWIYTTKQGNYSLGNIFQTQLLKNLLISYSRRLPLCLQIIFHVTN